MHCCFLTMTTSSYGSTTTRLRTFRLRQPLLGDLVPTVVIRKWVKLSLEENLVMLTGPSWAPKFIALLGTKCGDHKGKYLLALTDTKSGARSGKRMFALTGNTRCFHQRVFSSNNFSST